VEDDADREFVEWSRHLIDPRELFDSPEEAALAGWRHTPSAHARVVEVRRDDDSALVVIEVDGAPGFHDRDACTCERFPNGKWRCSGSTGW
jgi:hypothetical protein